jgi:hypothetical protein
MTIAIGVPQLEVIAGTCYKRLIADYRMYSTTVEKWFLIPKGFVYDEESTPWRGENPIAGLVHDFVSRKGVLDSKILAARVYLEFQRYEDSLRDRPWYTRAWDSVWRGLKAATVAIVPSFVYWHKYSINATAEEML